MRSDGGSAIECLTVSQLAAFPLCRVAARPPQAAHPPPPCRCSESSFTNFQTMWVSNDGGFNEARRAGDRLPCWTPTDADLISDFRCCAGAGIWAPMEGKRVGGKRGPAHSRLLAG